MTDSGKSGPSSYRPWPQPERSWVMSMRWHDLLFLHWRVPVEELRPHIPEPLRLEQFDGSAWVGVVPFWMSRIRPRFLPPMPYLSRFPELNVRTYVTDGNHPGVWFFTLEAARWLAVKVARWTYHLNYRWATMSTMTGEDGTVQYRSERKPSEPGHLIFEGSYRQGEPVAHESDSLETFLTARYCLYASDGNGRVYRGDIDHQPWDLYRAEADIDRLETDEPGGTQFDRPPGSVLYSPKIDVRAWAPVSMDGVESKKS